MSSPCLRLRPTRWSVLLQAADGRDQEIEEHQWYEDGHGDDEKEFAFPWMPGNPAYGDPHEFDRHAIAALYSAYDVGLVADWAGLAARGALDFHSLSSTRSGLIREWSGMGDPVYPDSHGFYTEAMLRANQASGLAGTYLHRCGLSLDALASLRPALSQVIDQAGLGDGSGVQARGGDRGDDDLDRTLYCLRMGMSAGEVQAGLARGAWPDWDAVAVLAAFRAAAT